MKFKKFLVATLTLIVSTTSLCAAPQVSAKDFKPKANETTVKVNKDFKPVTPQKPETLPAVTKEVEATAKIHEMMPRGSSHVKTELQTIENTQYYQVVFTYRAMSVEGYVNAKTGEVSKIEARDMTPIDLNVKNVFNNNPNYKPKMHSNEAEVKAKTLLTDSKVVEYAILGEYKLLWAYRTVVANDKMILEVIVDTETSAIKAVNAYPIVKNENFISEQKVLEIIKQQVPQGTIRSLTLDKVAALYNVDVVDLYHQFTFKIDAKTGNILDYTKLPIDQTTVLTKEQIIRIINNQPDLKKVVISDIKLDEKHMIYTVNGKDDQFKYVIEVNAKTGRILKVEKNKLDVKPEENKLLTEEEIINIITSQSKYKNVTITDIELDGVVYEVEGTDGKFEYDFEVHAKTGKILEADKEEIDDEDDDEEWDD